jgi:serine/threonine protein kinase
VVVVLEQGDAYVVRVSFESCCPLLRKDPALAPPLTRPSLGRGRGDATAFVCVDGRAPRAPRDALATPDPTRPGRAQLSDFGIARKLEDSFTSCSSFVGTFNYMSPERLLGDTYNYTSDVWSVGMLLLTCALGHYPLAQQTCDNFWRLLQVEKCGCWIFDFARRS